MRCVAWSTNLTQATCDEVGGVALVSNAQRGAWTSVGVLNNGAFIVQHGSANPDNRGYMLRHRAFERLCGCWTEAYDDDPASDPYHDTSITGILVSTLVDQPNRDRLCPAASSLCHLAAFPSASPSTDDNHCLGIDGHAHHSTICADHYGRACTSAPEYQLDEGHYQPGYGKQDSVQENHLLVYLPDYTQQSHPRADRERYTRDSFDHPPTTCHRGHLKVYTFVGSPAAFVRLCIQHNLWSGPAMYAHYPIHSSLFKTPNPESTLYCSDGTDFRNPDNTDGSGGGGGHQPGQGGGSNKTHKRRDQSKRKKANDKLNQVM
jgi:hypothetical protein